jgi:hypothetical protein
MEFQTSSNNSMNPTNYIKKNPKLGVEAWFIAL